MAFCFEGVCDSPLDGLEVVGLEGPQDEVAGGALRVQVLCEVAEGGWGWWEFGQGEEVLLQGGLGAAGTAD